MVVRVLEIDLQDVVVDVDDRGVDLYPVGLAEHLELHHRHRPRRVLHERLVDRDADLLARDELTPDEVLFEMLRASEATRAQCSQERADAFHRFEVATAGHRPDGAAMGEGLVNGEVEPVVPLSIVVPSSGSSWPSSASRPQAGHCQAS